jgi:hypothetical protein
MRTMLSTHRETFGDIRQRWEQSSGAEIGQRQFTVASMPDQMMLMSILQSGETDKASPSRGSTAPPLPAYVRPLSVFAWPDEA